MKLDVTECQSDREIYIIDGQNGGVEPILDLDNDNCNVVNREGFNHDIKDSKIHR